MTFLPIVERELRVTARKPGTYWLRFFAALAVILIFLCAALGNSNTSPGRVAQEVFDISSVLVLGGCLCAGVIQTADCLSSEKREGTIGLLFLTDLRGYDVVFGKLVSSSINSVYGLLSILPVLGLPLLMGGVSGGEFWRIILVLLDALFFSLGIGMVISAVSRETRQALAVTAFIVLVFTGVLPAIYASVGLLFPRANLPVQLFLWPSPGYAFNRAADQYFHSSYGPHEYWGSILTDSIMGLVCLLLATIMLPLAWQERGVTGRSGKGRREWLHFGSNRRRRRLRAATLQPNPFYWLSIRDRMPRIGTWLLMGLAMPLWLSFFGDTLMRSRTAGWGSGFIFLIYTTFGFSLAFKCMVAIESTRRLNDDRRNGALELLLVTPLTEKQIVSAQLRALWRMFRLPGALLLFFLAALIWLMYRPGSPTSADDTLLMICVGTMVVLITDFYALGWLGMWTGLRARQHHRAILGTVARVLLIPWLLYLLMGFSGLFNTPGGGKVFIAAWFLLGVVNDVFWVERARRGLLNQFRPCAAGIISKNRRSLPPATAEPAVA
jgi:ABC-type transport system involved in cytochrome c biogenesis permease component